MNKGKKWLVALSVVTAMAASGIAMAATTDQSQGDCKPRQEARGEFRDGMKQFRQDHVKLLELLKIDAETFRAEMKSGKTLLDIAKAHDVSEKTLTNFLAERMTQHIDAGVKAGRLTAEQAEKMKAEQPKRIDDMIHGKGPVHNGPGHRPGHGPFDNTKLLGLLKVDQDTLRSELRSGKTLLVVANEHGVSETELKECLISEMTERIDAGVKAGRIPAEKAEAMKAHMADRVNDMINGKGPMHKGPGPRAEKPERE